MNPIRDGAVLPILHLNGYKINNPTIWARVPHDEIEAFFRGTGWTPYFVEGSDPETMHQAMAATVDKCVAEIKAAQKQARDSCKAFRPRWPMIVLRTPKGWTSPGEVGGHKLEGSWRAHQVPMANVKKDPARLKELEAWMKSYKPQELFDEKGRFKAELKAIAPTGTRRIGSNPQTGGRSLPISVHCRRAPMPRSPMCPRASGAHTSQLPPHAVVQQKPSTQKPLAHWLAPVQAAPLDCFTTQLPDALQ